jgi:hypothetical protein
MSPSDLMRELVYELLARHDVSTDGTGATLHLTLDGQDQLLIEEVEPKRLWRMVYLSLRPGQKPTVELEIQFFVDDERRWVPFTIYRPQAGFKIYADVDLAAAQLAVTDSENQWALAAYCDAWSFYLRQQGWPERGVMT